MYLQNNEDGYPQHEYCPMDTASIGSLPKDQSSLNVPVNLESGGTASNLCPGDTAAGIYLALNDEPSSQAAVAFTDTLAAKLWTLAPRKLSQPTRKFRQAVGALAADLASIAAAGPAAYGYRSMKAGSFSRMAVGYKVLKAAVDTMSEAGLLMVQVPIYRPSPVNWTARTATTFRPTIAFLSLAEHHGIYVAERSGHYRPRSRPMAIPYPIVRRASSNRFGQRRQTGGDMPVDRSDPRVHTLWSEVDRINAFWAKQTLEGGQHHAFQRIFNEGDQAGFAWNKGGRLYSIGAGNYQQLRKCERRSLRINGESVVEVDISGSFLTIYLALMGIPQAPVGTDPYGLSIFPREVIKSWVNMTLGHDKFHRSWPKEKQRLHAKTSAIKLQDEHPIVHVRKEALRLFPALNGWRESAYRWADFQYIESNAIIGAMVCLMQEHSVPALPMHDALIVPVSTANLTQRVLSTNFLTSVGVVPTLKIK